MRRLGYTARLVGWHAAVLALILGVSAAVLDWTARRIVLDQFDAALLHAAQSVAAEIADEGPGSPVPAMPVKRVRRLLWSFQPVIQVSDAQGAVATLLGVHDPLPVPFDRIRGGRVVFQTLEAVESRMLRMVALRATHAGAIYGVVVAHPLDELHVLLHRLRLLILGSAVAILVTILLVDLVLTRRVWRPIEAIVGRARTLSEATISERLPHPGEPGELARLVETLNEMLGRLQEGFEAQRRFTADAAHELRSPLTRLRTEMEVAMRRPRDLEEHRTILANTLEEIQRLGGLTENLLVLARLDAGEGREVASGQTPLASVLDGVIARFEGAAAARRVDLRVHPAAADVTVMLQASIVDVVLANVVDNAVKFTRPGGSVELNVMAAAHDGIVTVTDTGPGIPDDELPHVFDRFWRGRMPRTVGAPGVGLGLAIVHTLVGRQAGRIDIDSKLGAGTTVTIRFPLSRDTHAVAR